MSLETSLIRRVVLFGACVLGTFVVTNVAAAQIPSPALLITINGEGPHALEIADPLTGKVVGSVPIGGGASPHEVAVSADGRLAFVTMHNFASSFRNDRTMSDDAISVIDLASRKEVRRFETGPGSIPYDLVFASGKVYFTSEGYGLVGRYDPASNRVDMMVGTGQYRTHTLVVSKEANKIFTANSGSNSVTALGLWDPAIDHEKFGHGDLPRWSLSQITTGQGPEGIAMSPDEKEVWALNRGDGSVSIIDVVTKRVSQTLSLKTENPIRLAFTPDGKRVIILARNSLEVLFLDTVTRKEIKRIRLGTQAQGFAKDPVSPMLLHDVLITPDGSRAYVVVLGGKGVAVIDMKTLQFTNRISTGSEPEDMAWAVTR